MRSPRWNWSSCRTCSSTRPPRWRTCSSRAPRSWRRTARSPTPSAASTACARHAPAQRQAGVAGRGRAVGRTRRTDALRRRLADHGRDRGAHAHVRRCVVRQARRGGQRAVAVQRGAPHSARRSCTRARSCVASAGSPPRRTCPPTRRAPAGSRCCSPPAASSASTTWARRPAAPPTSRGTAKTCSRSTRTTPKSAASATATR
jgi:hypothetical protein